MSEKFMFMSPTIQDRKLHIIKRLTVLDDEQIIQLIENLLFEETEIQDDAPLSDSELQLVQERVADYHNNPDDEVSWETVQKILRNRNELRPYFFSLSHSGFTKNL